MSVARVLEAEHRNTEHENLQVGGLAGRFFSVALDRTARSEASPCVVDQ